jgi:hypothetical protein
MALKRGVKGFLHLDGSVAGEVEGQGIALIPSSSEGSVCGNGPLPRSLYGGNFESD